MSSFTHIDKDGRVRMVDVTDKKETLREAGREDLRPVVRAVRPAGYRKGCVGYALAYQRIQGGVLC